MYIYICIYIYIYIIKCYFTTDLIHAESPQQNLFNRDGCQGLEKKPKEWEINGIPSGYVKIAMENGHLVR